MNLLKIKKKNSEKKSSNKNKEKEEDDKENDVEDDKEEDEEDDKEEDEEDDVEDDDIPEDVEEYDVDNDLDEGFKTKKSKKKTTTSLEPSIFEQYGLGAQDVVILKTISGTVFHLFLAFYMSYSWYYNWFIDKPDPSVLEYFKWLQVNNITDFVSQYAVLLIEKSHGILFTVFPEGLGLIKSLSNGFLGNRFIFFIIFSSCYALVQPMLKYFTKIITVLKNKIIKIYRKIYSGAKSKDVIKTIIDDLIELVNSLSFQVLTGVMGFFYLIVYIQNVALDNTKGVPENAFVVLPSFLIKLMSGTIFYIIWLFFKFALLFTPSISIATFVITLMFLYYSFVRMDNPFTTMFNINENINLQRHDNNETTGTTFQKVFFNERPLTERFGTFINGFEKILAWIAYMFPFLFFIFELLKTSFNMFNIDNLYLFIGIIIALIGVIVTLITAALNTFGFSKDISNKISQEAKTFSFSGLFDNGAASPPTGKTPSDFLRNNIQQILNKQKLAFSKMI